MLNGFLLVRSMTACGRGMGECSLGRLVVDVQSVNRRFLEVAVVAPRLLTRFEMEVRKLVAAYVGRGMVTISLSWTPSAQRPMNITPNFAWARALKEGWEKLAKELHLPHELPLKLLTQENDLFLPYETPEEEPLYAQTVQEGVKLALEALVVMKRKEGATLAHDIHQRLDTLRSHIQFIEANSHGATEKYRQKLKSRLEEVVGNRMDTEEKILLEVAVFAEKVDITEEVVRFRSHLDQFGQVLDQPLELGANSRGKTLDFFLQELLRESNTIGSKASDKGVIQSVVNIKSELEKIKEQVQNIE